MSSPVKVGDVLADKYRVERVLGMGGMGVVVAARHMSLGERVAIKFLLPQAMARADVVARFLREGQASARLKSEHITRVHDVGKLPTGEPFLVMEYLDGKDLGALLREDGPLAPEAAVGFVMQACEALAEAHAAGIVHRDLKPSNLFVIQKLDGSPSIKLIDFGISKVQVPDAEGAAGEMTATAVMMGSPLYMAPEQMASARDVDARADIWSLGILLHTLLAGAPPFRAPTVMGVYELITQGAPPIRAQRPDIPEALEAAILRCLMKDRGKRFADVGELAEALAPAGPPDAPAAAERIKRILATRAAMGSIPTPIEAPVVVAALTPAQPSADTEQSAPASRSHAAREVSAPSQPSGSSAAVDPHPTTEGPWDQRTRPPAPSRRRGALIIAAAVLALAVPAAFFALRAAGGGVAPAVDPAVTAVAPPATSASAAEPTPTVAPAEPAPTATAAPSVTGITSASAAVPPRPAAPSPAPLAAPARPAPAPAPPAKAARPRPAEGLFDTQK